MGQPREFAIEKICARVTWHMARNHGWGKWTPTEVILTNGLTNEEMSFASDNLIPLIKKGVVPFIQFRQDCLRLDGEMRTEISYFLRDVGGYSEIQIEATMSRFQGFDGTESPDTNYFDDL